MRNVDHEYCGGVVISVGVLERNYEYQWGIYEYQWGIYEYQWGIYEYQWGI